MENVFANKLGRLAQCVGNRIEGTNTINFRQKSTVPKNKKVTYGRLVCDIKENKTETHRTRLTVGGNLLDFAGLLSTFTATVTTAKCLFNSVISTPGAKCLITDIKNFYLNNDIPDPEYMKFHIHIIPQERIDEYALHKIVGGNGWVYLEIVKGMYGSEQAGIIANMELTKHLDNFGYHPVQHTPGLWKHNTREKIFTLVVDDFAIKYASKQDADHLLQALCAKYIISTDWDAFLHIGITLNWNYVAGNDDLSMPKYAARALHKFKQALQKFHPNNKPEYSPHKHVEPKYGKKVRYEEPTDDAPTLASVDINLIQKIAGTFLYYGIAVDNTILVALGTIASEQSYATSNTAKKITELLNYLATNPDETICYKHSDMVLWVHSDTSYLYCPKARIRAGGMHFLSDKPPSPNNQTNFEPTLNVIVYVVCKILRNIMASAAESELGALFLHCQEAVPIRVTLEEMGHPQPPTPVQVDNSTSLVIATGKIK